MKTTQLNTKKSIQVISLNKSQNYYAQNDIIIDHSSLNKNLSTMNKEWERSLQTASKFDTLSNVLIATTAASFLSCLFIDDTSTASAFCAGFLILPLIWSPMIKKSNRITHKVVEEFNAGFQK